MGQTTSTPRKYATIPDHEPPALRDPSQLSVVLPSLNEAPSIHRAIHSVAVPSHKQPEVVVSDGGSSDDTVAVAQACATTVVQGSAGRGRQLHAGALHTSGDWLLFLHADARLPEGYFQQMVTALDTPRQWSAWPALRGAPQPARRQWGCFATIETGLPGMAPVAWGTRVRTSVLSMPYGDQALFCSRAAYEEVGGFRDWPILEDVDLVRRLRARYGRPAIVPRAVWVSPRRWQHYGIVRTTLINQAVLLGFAAGVPVPTLAALYNAARHRYVGKT